mgnify:CR=1 FL=1
MTTLEFSHNSGLVVVSFLIALVAGFTGLTLTKDLSQKSFSQRKIAVSLASVALGGGIWSMHFVAMLGLQMPVLFYYDAAITLASALLAILIVGVALGLLHFFERRPKILFLSGSLVGFGILTMHYLGMAGLQLCRPIYTVQGISLAFLSAISLCVAAIWIAYEQRSNRNILLGTVCFGLAVFAVPLFSTAHQINCLCSPASSDPDKCRTDNAYFPWRRCRLLPSKYLAPQNLSYMHTFQSSNRNWFLDSPA